MVGTIKDFFGQQEDSGGKSELQKYSEALWLPKNAQEIETPPEVHAPTPEELGINGHAAATQAFMGLSKKLSDLTGRMTSAEHNKDSADRIGLNYLVNEFNPEQPKLQSVGLNKDVMNRHGAQDGEFTFGVKNLSDDARTADAQYARLERDAAIASKYFEHVAVERLTDEKTGKSVAIVVIRDHGEFLGAREFSAVVSAEREKEQLGLAKDVAQKEMLRTRSTEPLQAESQKPGLPAIDFDKVRNQFPAKNPSEAGQQAEPISPKPVYIAQQQEPTNGKGGRAV